MRITSLGLWTDVALRVLEGAEVIDRGDHLVVRSLHNPDFWWGNFLLLRTMPELGTAGRWLGRFAAEFPVARHVALAIDTTDERAAIPGDFSAAGLESHHATVLTCADVRPPPHRSAGAQLRPLDSDTDWQQSYELGVRCFGDDGAQDYLKRRAAARPSARSANHRAATQSSTSSSSGLL